MKKAKIMLTAIGVFAIVGGALAIKANRSTDFVFTSDPNDGICSVKVFNRTTKPGSPTIGLAAVTTIESAPCIAQTVYLGK